MGPFESTRTDPLTSGPWPWVETVSTPSGSISVRTVSPPSSLDHQIAGEIHHRFGGNPIALGVVEIDSGTDGRNVRMKGGGRGTARLGG